MGVMSLSEIMDKSIELLRKYMKSIVAFVLLYGVVWLGGAFALTLISIIGVLISREAFIYVILPLLFIIGFAVLLTVNAGIIKIVGQEYFKQKVDAMGAFKTAFANFIKICGLIIVITLIALPLAVVLYALGRAFTSAFGGIIVSIEDYNWGIVLIIFLIMLTMLLAAAVIIGFISIFSFSVHSMVLEGKGVFSSIKRSYQLVRYNYWKVFGCLILFYVST
ncbi:MAG: hypothetical protein Q8930_16160, partial [Bacillota bacterium]|nr:hypothetical protein [Bacillota bacterium]